MLSFQAHGIPAPKGSTRAFVRGRRAIVTADNARTKPWESVVAHAALDAMGGERAMLTGPLRVELDFCVPRPKKLLRCDGTPLDPSHLPITRPDLDKLVRAVLDALTVAGVWIDDAQVVTVRASKTYGAPGVSVLVERETRC